MIVKIDAPLDPVAWQCVFQAVQDHRERHRSEYVFETPAGDCTVVVVPHKEALKATARIAAHTA